jgi:hypothetical protein
MAEPEQKKNKDQKPKTRIRRRWIVLFSLVFLLGLYTAAGFWLVPRVLITQVEEKGSAALGRRVTLDQVAFNPFTLRLEAEGLVVKALEGRSPLLKIDSLKADLDGFLSLVNQALVMESITIRGPYFQIIHYKDGHYNISDLIKELTGGTGQKDETESKFFFSFNNIRLTAGLVEFADRARDTFHWVNDITISLPQISNLPKLVKTQVQPSFSAVVNGTPLKIGGTTKPFASSHDSDFKIDIDDLNLPHYLSYLPGKRNFVVAEGSLSTRLKLTFHQEKKDTRLTLSGTVEVDNLQLQGRGKDRFRFIKLPEIRVQVDPGNLLDGELFLREVVISRPEINVHHKPDGVFYFPRLVAAVTEKPKTATPPPAAGAAAPAGQQKFSFRMDRFRVEQGRLNLRDDRVSPTFVGHLEPVDIELTDLKVPGTGRASYQLKMVSEIGENIEASGDFALEPELDVHADLALNGLPLARYTAYYSDYFAGRFPRGRVDVAGKLVLVRSSAGELGMNFQDLEARLSDLELVTPAGEKICEIPRLAAAEGILDLDRRLFVIGSLTGEKGRFEIDHRPDGAFNFNDLLIAGKPAAETEPAPAETPTETAAKTATETAGAPADSGSAESPSPSAPSGAEEAWQVHLLQGHLTGFEVLYRDRTLKHPARIEASNIDLKLDGIGTGKGESGNFKLGMNLARSGKIGLAGQLTLDPFKLGLDLDLKKIPLKAFQPWLSEYLDLVLVRGRAAVKGQMVVAAAGSAAPEISFAGRAAIDRLKAVDSPRRARFLELGRVNFSDIAYRSRPAQLALSRVGVTNLKVFVERDREGRTNLDRILRRPGSPGPATKQPAEESGVKGDEEEDSGTPTAAGSKPETAPALSFALEKLMLAKTSFAFFDQSVSPPFRMELGDLKGEIVGLTSLGKKPAAIALTGRLNRHAPIQVSGKIDPLVDNLFADVKISGKNISLTDLTPYTGKYIGYVVGKGKAALDLKYQIKNGRLQAQNVIFLDQFAFGSEVNSPDAVSLPVRLAVALLKDRNGEIHLNLPVSGRLDDPDFSVAGLVWKVLVNLITKAATSPFALIGALAGGGEELNLIDFPAGQAELDAGARERLDKLAKALYDRPGLKVELIGHADRKSDAKALHEAAFERMLKNEKFKELADAGKAPENPDQVKIAEDEFNDYLWRVYKEAPLPGKKKNFIGLVKKVPPAEQERLLRASIKITDDDLVVLARQRARAVMQYLTEKGPVEANRLFLVNPQLADGGDAAGRRVELKIK